MAREAEWERAQPESYSRHTSRWAWAWARCSWVNGERPLVRGDRAIALPEGARSEVRLPRRGWGAEVDSTLTASCWGGHGSAQAASGVRGLAAVVLHMQWAGWDCAEAAQRCSGSRKGQTPLPGQLAMPHTWQASWDFTHSCLLRPAQKCRSMLADQAWGQQGQVGN